MSLGGGKTAHLPGYYRRLPLTVEVATLAPKRSPPLGSWIKQDPEIEMTVIG